MENSKLESKADVAVSNIQEVINSLIAMIEELEEENEALKKKLRESTIQARITDAKGSVFDIPTTQPNYN